MGKKWKKNDKNGKIKNNEKNRHIYFHKFIPFFSKEKYWSLTFDLPVLMLLMMTSSNMNGHVTFAPAMVRPTTTSSVQVWKLCPLGNFKPVFKLMYDNILVVIIKLLVKVGQALVGKVTVTVLQVERKAWSLSLSLGTCHCGKPWRLSCWQTMISLSLRDPSASGHTRYRRYILAKLNGKIECQSKQKTLKNSFF